MSSSPDIPVYNHQDYRGSNYKHPQIPQRAQPLPPPFFSRNDTQGIPAGLQFDGRLPDAPQAPLGTLAGPGVPAHGGRWMYAGDVIVTRIEFVSQGEETAPGRTDGSGFYILRKGGFEHRLLDISSETTASFGVQPYFWLDTPFVLKQGEILRLRTFDAAKEMEATISVETLRPYIGR
jgi:hypothetical protein